MSDVKSISDDKARGMAEDPNNCFGSEYSADDPTCVGGSEEDACPLSVLCAQWGGAPDTPVVEEVSVSVDPSSLIEKLSKYLATTGLIFDVTDSEISIDGDVVLKEQSNSIKFKYSPSALKKCGVPSNLFQKEGIRYVTVGKNKLVVLSILEKIVNFYFQTGVVEEETDIGPIETLKKEEEFDVDSNSDFNDLFSNNNNKKKKEDIKVVKVEFTDEEVEAAHTADEIKEETDECTLPPVEYTGLTVIAGDVKIQCTSIYDKVLTKQHLMDVLTSFLISVANDKQ